VTVQNKLADYLAPLVANGQLMMRTQLNDKLSRYNSTENFKKLGTLNPSRIFFIVSKNTASASELLINNLKPYVDVQLVGPNKTYGKPVGYFPVPVGDWYVFPVSSRTTNKNGEGAYFDGMELTRQAADGLDKNWGDLQESCLANIVNYINGATLGQAGRTRFKENAEVVRSNDVLAKPAFKGTIDTRRLQ
jgi:carboxyl-terminal processing protease